MKKTTSEFCVLFITLFFIACKPDKINIVPHKINPDADIFYKQALALLEYYDKDSTVKCLNILEHALVMDSLNPDYYGLKAKLLAEMGLLDSALIVQSHADKTGAITGEYLFQLGLFQAAKEMGMEAKESFKRSNEYLQTVLKKYPDSLGAFIIQQAANSLYLGQDCLFMDDVQEIRKRFPNRQIEVEMTRRVKPSSLIKQIRNIEIDARYDINFNLDSLMEEAERTGKSIIPVK